RVDYALDRSNRDARRSQRGGVLRTFVAPLAHTRPPNRSLHGSPAPGGTRPTWGRLADRTAATTPASSGVAGAPAGRPATVPNPGSPGLIEGRNPLSDTTDVTSDVSGEPVDTDQGGTTRRRRTGTGLSAM